MRAGCSGEWGCAVEWVALGDSLVLRDGQA